MTLSSLALDTSDFAWIRTEGQVYVDKTRYIQQMLAESRKYVFVARPRRFGKSLLVSTLAHLFNRTNDDLFEGLDIAESGFLDHVPRMPVLTLDMSSVEGDSAAAVRNDLSHLVYGLAQQFDFIPPATATPARALDMLCAHLQRHHGRFAVLVDEYDAPLTDLVYRPTFSAQDKAETQAHLRAFYRTLKRWDGAIHFAFLTGIVQVEGAGLFSALNNLANLSDHPAYNAVCGFTEAEIDRFLTPHVAGAARNFGCSCSAMRAILREQYNGYSFGAFRESVYNPVSLLWALEKLNVSDSAETIRKTDLPQPWIETGRPAMLLRWIRALNLSLHDMRASPKGVHTYWDVEYPDLNALMYQTGFLTIKQEKDSYVLDFPNREVMQAFQEDLFPLYFGKSMAVDSPERQLVHEVADAFATGNIEAALDAASRVLDLLNHDELGHESHYKVAFRMLCFMCTSIMDTGAEEQVRWGRLDLRLRTHDTTYVFEVKLDKTVEEAVVQIRRQRYLDKYVARRERAVGIALHFLSAPHKGDHRALDVPKYEWTAVPASNTCLRDGEYPAAWQRWAATRDEPSERSTCSKPQSSPLQCQ